MINKYRIVFCIAILVQSACIYAHDVEQAPVVSRANRVAMMQRSSAAPEAIRAQEEFASKVVDVVPSVASSGLDKIEKMGETVSKKRPKLYVSDKDSIENSITILEEVPEVFSKEIEPLSDEDPMYLYGSKIERIERINDVTLLQSQLVSVLTPALLAKDPSLYIQVLAKVLCVDKPSVKNIRDKLVALESADVMSDLLGNISINKKLFFAPGSDDPISIFYIPEFNGIITKFSQVLRDLSDPLCKEARIKTPDDVFRARNEKNSRVILDEIKPLSDKDLMKLYGLKIKWIGSVDDVTLLQSQLVSVLTPALLAKDPSLYIQVLAKVLCVDKPSVKNIRDKLVALYSPHVMSDLLGKISINKKLFFADGSDDPISIFYIPKFNRILNKFVQVLRDLSDPLCKKAGIQTPEDVFRAQNESVLPKIVLSEPKSPGFRPSKGSSSSSIDGFGS